MTRHRRSASAPYWSGMLALVLRAWPWQSRLLNNLKQRLRVHLARPSNLTRGRLSASASWRSRMLAGSCAQGRGKGDVLLGRVRSFHVLQDTCHTT